MTFELTSQRTDNRRAVPGSRIVVRGAVWKVVRADTDGAARILHCVGLSGIVRGKSSVFIDRLEPDLDVLEPTNLTLTRDSSSNFTDTKLYLEAAFRNTPPTGRDPVALGGAAIDDLAFQHVPVRRILEQARVRLLIADDVGLGKTLEAGLIASELILRHRADRILVVSTRAMLAQFQREFWTRFSIPLARLDSSAIKRMRNAIPASYNVFDQFDRAIVSIDTLKKDLQYRVALESSRWDLIIIDEAHNVATRKSSAGSRSQRARLARLLAQQTDALLLLTATPHDGSPDSFSSLIEMLDETRVPNPAALRREDIDDLVVRRFRSTPDVQDAIRKRVEKRQLFKRDFPLGAEEDAAYDCVANLKLDIDETTGGKRKATDLFRTTLAKALFSSPSACFETVKGRLSRMWSGVAKGTEADRDRLERLACLLDDINDQSFAKYQNLLKLLGEINWNGRDPRDRIVIFSERIATLDWLLDHLSRDLGMPEGAIAKVDGSSVEADERTQKVLEEFGQEGSRLRILLASDMASEGLNLHFQCHRLIHFDLPWSLLRFQQRNGRIDRYGQDRQPQIYYFIGESSHERVRDMWVLDKLVEKDEAAQHGIGDPAVFLGRGDIEGEEEVVAKAVADGVGEDAFEAQMDARAQEASADAATDDWALLFSEYGDAPAPELAQAIRPPRLFPDTFSFTSEMLRRSSGANDDSIRIDPDARVIRFRVPDDLKANDAFGYGAGGQVDDRYMPVEAVGAGGYIELTDRADVVTSAIEQARSAERAWPSVQYLWDVHPIVGWLNDRAEALFGHAEAPLCEVTAGLNMAEVAVLVHGTIANGTGHPEVNTWAVIRFENERFSRLDRDIAGFLKTIGFNADTPNPGGSGAAPPVRLLEEAVEVFRNALRADRKDRQAELDANAKVIRERLSGFKHRFDAQLSLDFGDADTSSDASLPERARLSRKARQARRTEDMFRAWENWIEGACTLNNDPDPHVDIKAVFRRAGHGA